MGKHHKPREKDIIPRQTRLYIYNISLALIPLLVTLGFITEAIAPFIIALTSAILGLGTARAHLTQEETNENTRDN